MSLAETITIKLGGDWYAQRRFGLCPGPGHSKNDRSLKIGPHEHNPDDVFIHSFSGDDVLALKKEWREQGLLPRGGRNNPDHAKAAKVKNEKQKRDADAAAKSASAVAWSWSQRRSANGTIIQKYFVGRGIDIDPLPATIGYLPPNPPKYPWPTMIKAFGMPEELEPGVYSLSPDRVSAVHLTYLSPDGSGKAPVKPQRRIIGKALGSPLAVFPPGNGLGLLIGEGIETTLSRYLELEGLLGCWAAGSAGFMPALANAVPNYIEVVTIAADPDPAGRRGGEELARRLNDRGIETIWMEV